MMLSPSAARLGSSIRLKGKSIPFRHYSVGGNRRLNDGLSKTSSVVRMPMMETSRFLNLDRLSDTSRHQRCKSTISVADYETDESSPNVTSNTLGLSYMGHAAAAEYRAQQQQQLQDPQVNPSMLASESWRINLGRGNDNAWLMGPRKDKDWFTGIAPNQNCPGKVVWSCLTRVTLLRVGRASEFDCRRLFQCIS